MLDTPSHSDLSHAQALRVELAAAFRWAVRFGWHESVANHFSAALTPDGRRFLLNPKWQHFSTIRARDLVAVDLDAPERAAPLDASALTIHGAVHARVPAARVVLHCHPCHATALAGLKDPTLKPIDQNTARFYNRVSYDLGFGGLGDTAAEGARLAAALGNHNIMLMGNHGVLVTAESVAHAMELLYYFERAAKTMLLAYASGQELSILPPDLAEETARGWDDYRGLSDAHFAHMKAVLDAEEPDYKA
ncbi:MAG: class II aldolase/adducin family protein [Pseudomonadota bacterium]